LAALLLTRLLVVDDQEFLESDGSQNLLTISQIAELVPFLNRVRSKQLIYGLYFNNLRISPYALPMLERSENLLSHLYDRQCRRPFMPQSDFEIAEIDPAALVQGCIHNPARFNVLLSHIPHVFSFQARAHVLRILVRFDQSHFYDRVSLLIDRSRFFESTTEQLRHTSGTALRTGLNVNFIGVDGLREPGADGGGLTKEFLTLFGEAAFNPGLGLFVENEMHALSINPHSNYLFRNDAE
jgi:hypothetical protein